MSRHQRALALFSAILALSLMGTGCQMPGTEPIPGPSLVPREGSQSMIWLKNETGFETMAITNHDSTSTIGIMYAFDPAKFCFSFEVATSGKSVIEWLNASSSLVAVMNGTYFHEDFTPAGLLIHEGKAQNARRFDADKSAVIRLAPNPAIIDTNDTYDTSGTLEAAQSYPSLIHGGQFAITEDSGKKARRSFVAIRDDGFIVFGVIAKSELTLYELSQLLNNDAYRLVSALNMDGGSSTGLFTKDEGVPSFNSVFPVPNVMGVYKRSD